MSRWDLQDQAAALSIDHFLELLDHLCMEFVKLVARHHLADEFPQDHILARASLCLLLLDLLD